MAGESARRPSGLTDWSTIPLLATAMLRVEVWSVNFDPSLGGEIQKTRPDVIVSNDASNRTLNRIQVVPITSRADRVLSLRGARQSERPEIFRPVLTCL